MTRKQALACITAYRAESGRFDMHAMRVYIENRVSYKAALEAAHKGIAIYERRQKSEQSKIAAEKDGK